MEVFDNLEPKRPPADGSAARIPSARAPIATLENRLLRARQRRRHCLRHRKPAAARRCRPDRLPQPDHGLTSTRLCPTGPTLPRTTHAPEAASHAHPSSVLRAPFAPSSVRVAPRIAAVNELGRRAAYPWTSTGVWGTPSTSKQTPSGAL